MQELKQYFKIFFCLISIIMSMGIAFYFTNHNNLKENINLNNKHLKDNINQVEKKVDEFRKETNYNFNKIDTKIDKLKETIMNIKGNNR